MEIDRRTPAYPMRVVEELTGLSGRQIRYYDQMGLVQPKRTLGRQRLYSSQDVERLKQVKEMLAKGLSLNSIRTQFRRADEQSAAASRAADFRNIATQNESRTGGPIVRGLRSVYPVSNQAELYDVVDRPTVAPPKPTAPPARPTAAPARLAKGEAAKGEPTKREPEKR